MNRTLFDEAIDETKAQRAEAKNNARVALEKGFVPEYNRMFGGNLKEEQMENEGVKISYSVNEEDIDEILTELEEEVSGKPVKKVKKPSFIQNLVASFYRQKPSTMVCRFQKLAGITKVEPAAKLTIGNNVVELSEIPPWYNILRYTLCGFKFEIPNKC